jgi:glycerol transport system ATP-binding protein
MARIDLDLAHAYVANPQSDEDYALLPLRFSFEDGGAYALLGPSGCGKTTLLNCISGLLRPSQGRILFDGRDVTADSPQARNIAQVFQFPVIYDTMTVGENLAFPLRNRGVPPAQVRERVGRVAEMLDLSGSLDRRASGLAADAKQKISLGRGLVRQDVSAILFDEPLTVIDPQLKWQLRRKLKEIHHEFRLTLIYVTHDQTEALTFADQVVVMSRGKAVQVGPADALFERPAHTFVGHFIGSPGMNFLPANWRDGAVDMAGRRYMPALPEAVAGALQDAGSFRVGVRPEYLRLAGNADTQAVPVRVERAQDIGTYWLVTGSVQEAGGQVGTLRARLGPEAAALRPGDTAWLSVFNPHTCYYVNEVLVPWSQP